WKKVNKTFYDPTFGGLNWKDVHNRYLPLINTAEDEGEFYGLVNKMLWELKVSHNNIIPPGSFALYEPLVFAEGSAGLDIRLLDGTAVIISIKPESSAYKAGLRPGYVIQTIDGISVEQIVQQAELRVRPPYNSSNQIAIITKAILGRIYGASDKEVLISYTNERGEKSEKIIMRTKRDGVSVGPEGMFFFALDFETKLFDNGIGYIRLNTLQPQFADQISSAIKSMGNVHGIIFDLRGNSGGEIEEVPSIFLTERTLLYLRRSRGGETKVYIDPAEDAFKGPLVLLIDPLSGSASELLAACLQEIGRAVVVGERSPGSVLEMDRKIFLNGAIFMYPVAQLATPDGIVIEGHGVVPDMEVRLNREMLLKGIDSQIDSAIRYIEKTTSLQQPL
ncbi:MAG: S41 family peptidase, partial [Bacteroidales bacterium]|nr:S41 family peptidase [Bacteroidales bacterium]